jgi:hypothetical protein
MKYLGYNKVDDERRSDEGVVTEYYKTGNHRKNEEDHYSYVGLAGELSYLLQLEMVNQCALDTRLIFWQENQKPQGHVICRTLDSSIYRVSTIWTASALIVDAWDVSLILRLFSSIKKDITTKFVIS